MRVALTFYSLGSERTVWEDMPAVPRVGDRLHAASEVPSRDVLRSWLVRNVTWQNDHSTDEGWFPEVSLTK